MKKVLVGLAAATIVAIAAPTVTANVTDMFIQSAMEDLVAWDPEFGAIAPTASPAADQLFVAGSLKVTQASGSFQHTRVSAQSGPEGVDPRGSVRVTFFQTFILGTADLKGAVTCLVGAGNIAALAARLTEPFNGNTHVTLIVNDFGNPGPTMGQSPDSALIGFTSAPPPTTCVTEGSFFPGDMRGNLVVRAATP
jgi:hypothetical protein